MPARPQKRWQFSVFRLLLLSTLVAAIFGVLRMFEASPGMLVMAGVYFALLAVWAVLRWPDLHRNMKAIRRQRLAAIDQSRQAAIASARAKKAADAAGNAPSAAGESGESDPAKIQ